MGGIYGTGQQLLSLPQRITQASEQLRTTGQYDPAPAVEGMGWLAGGGMPAAERGAAGIFGGRLAVGAPLKSFERAQAAAGKGATPEDIWIQHGWQRGPGGQWSFEIPDTEAKLGPGAAFNLGSGEAELSTQLKYPYLKDYLQHERLYYHYPDLAHRPTDILSRGHAVGRYDPREASFGFDPTAIEDNPLSTALHENQHGVQHIEGFPRGASMVEAKDYTTKAMQQLGMISPAEALTGRFANPEMAKLQQKMTLDTYMKSAGEQEAYNVERRQPYGPGTRILRPPWRTETVPREQQILKYYKSPPPPSQFLQMIDALEGK